MHDRNSSSSGSSRNWYMFQLMHTYAIRCLQLLHACRSLHVGEGRPGFMKPERGLCMYDGFIKILALREKKKVCSLLEGGTIKLSDHSSWGKQTKDTGKHHQSANEWHSDITVLQKARAVGISWNWEAGLVHRECREQFYVQKVINVFNELLKEAIDMKPQWDVPKKWERMSFWVANSTAKSCLAESDAFVIVCFWGPEQLFC